MEVERTPALPDLLDAMGLPGLNRSRVAAALVGKSTPETTAGGSFSPAERQTEREAALSPRLKPGACAPKVMVTARAIWYYQEDMA